MNNMNKDYKALFERYSKELSDMEARLAKLDWAIGDKAKALGLGDGWSVDDLDARLEECRKGMDALDAKMSVLVTKLEGLV